MSVPQPAKPAKLVVGLFTARQSLLESIAEILTKQFGPIDLVSPWFLFDQTTYYHPEMGAPLYRWLLVFEPLIRQNDLARIKRFTNGVEAEFATDSRRAVNLDPGYLLHERFVLATGKNFTHRIYMEDGIYADLTLIYQKGNYRALPWTYPDYREPQMLQFLDLVRRKYGFNLAQENLRKINDQ